ncbi:MAG TPA: S9 family peptidase, partial [Thermoanaerobaculia bacterium]|nr:S9 family peptidase [Thermoanaerobaculia bacterium]
MRTIRFRSFVPLALAAAVVAAPPAPGQTGEGTDPSASTVSVPDTITATDVPPIVEAAVADFAPYENLRSASFNDWHPSERRMLVTTRFGEVTQLHEVAAPLGARRQLTFYDERVGGGTFRPGAPQQIGFSMDEGGAENYQLYVLDRASGEVVRLTDGIHRHQGAQFSNGGGRIAYVSNSRNGRDFDLYVMDPAKPDSERRVAELAGAWFPSDWSPDDSKIALVNYISVNDSSLWLVDVASGESTRLSPEPGDEPVSWGGAVFSPDGGSVYTTSDAGGEFQRLMRLDLASGEWTTLSADVDWNVQGFDVSDDGSLVAFFVNEDG